MKKLFLKNLIFLVICFGFILSPIGVQAEDKKIMFKPAVPLTAKFAAGVEVDGSTLGEYMNDIYKFSLGVVGILATIVMMWGGIRWITSGGSAESVGEAKAWITASLSGVVIALSAFSILYFVNPDLVKFRAVALPKVDGTKDTSISDCIMQQVTIKNDSNAAKISCTSTCDSSDISIQFATDGLNYCCQCNNGVPVNNISTNTQTSSCKQEKVMCGKTSECCADLSCISNSCRIP